MEATTVIIITAGGTTDVTCSHNTRRGRTWRHTISILFFVARFVVRHYTTTIMMIIVIVLLMMLMMVVIVVVVDGVRWMMGGFNNAAVHSLLLLVKDAFAYVTGQLLLSVLNEMGNSLFHFLSLSLSLSLCGKSSFAMRLLLSKANRKRLLKAIPYFSFYPRESPRSWSINQQSNFSSETKKREQYLVLITAKLMQSYLNIFQLSMRGHI